MGKGRFVRLAGLNTSLMLRQRINVCCGETGPQRTRPTRTVVFGRSCDFAITLTAHSCRWCGAQRKSAIRPHVSFAAQTILRLPPYTGKRIEERYTEIQMAAFDRQRLNGFHPGNVRTPEPQLHFFVAASEMLNPLRRLIFGLIAMHSIMRAATTTPRSVSKNSTIVPPSSADQQATRLRILCCWGPHSAVPFYGQDARKDDPMLEKRRRSALRP